MMSRVLWVAIVVCSTNASYGQEAATQKDGSVAWWGMGYGFEQTHYVPNVRGEIVVNGLSDVLLGSATMINFRAGYITSSYSSYVQVSDQDNAWRDISVCVSVLHRLTDVGALGVGAGFDWMRYEAHTVVTGPDYYYDAKGNKVENLHYGRDIGWEKVAPTVSVLSKCDVVLGEGARVAMLFYYKFSFPGSVHGPGVFHSVNTFGVTVALMRAVSQ